MCTEPCRDAPWHVSTIPKPGVDPSRSRPVFCVGIFCMFVGLKKNDMATIKFDNPKETIESFQSLLLNCSLDNLLQEGVDTKNVTEIKIDESPIAVPFGKIQYDVC